MENYMFRVPDLQANKEDKTDPIFLGTFTNVDSGFPKVLVDKIEEALKSLDPELMVTPMIIDPRTMGIIFGIIVPGEDGAKYRYDITISKHE